MRIDIENCDNIDLLRNEAHRLQTVVESLIAQLEEAKAIIIKAQEIAYKYAIDGELNDKQVCRALYILDQYLTKKD